MRYYISILMIFLSSLVFAQQGQLGKAEEAYKSGDYKASIALYEDVAKQYGVSSELYYNLGNAYYKDQSYAAAILNYERALMLDPENEDAALNLQMANAQTIDKIEAVKPLFLSVWVDNIARAMTSNAWAYTSVVFFLFFILGLVFYFFLARVALRKLGFFGAIVSIAFCVICNVFASSQKKSIEERNYAIVFAPIVTVKSAPAESGTELFVIHEGLKVKTLSSLGDWTEIELPDGNIGWMFTKDITQI